MKLLSGFLLTMTICSGMALAYGLYLAAFEPLIILLWGFPGLVFMIYYLIFYVLTRTFFRRVKEMSWQFYVLCTFAFLPLLLLLILFNGIPFF